MLWLMKKEVADFECDQSIFNLKMGPEKQVQIIEKFG